jgi:hypothetical protein
MNEIEMQLIQDVIQDDYIENGFILRDDWKSFIHLIYAFVNERLIDNETIRINRTRRSKKSSRTSY